MIMMGGGVGVGFAHPHTPIGTFGGAKPSPNIPIKTTVVAH